MPSILALESASSVELPADHDLLTWLVPYTASMHHRFAVGRDGKKVCERNVGRRGVLPLAQFGDRVWWMPLQPSNRRLGPLDSRFEEGRYLGAMDGSNTVLVGSASGVVKARIIKRLPPGERWTGSLLDEALGSELNTECTGRRWRQEWDQSACVGPHVAVPLPPLVLEVRQLRRAPLRHCVFFGSRTFVPVSWMCMKQTSVSHSSTESEIMSLDAGLRMDGLLALTYGTLLSRCCGTNKDNIEPVHMSSGKLGQIQPNQGESQLYTFEDNEAVIKMIIQGRRPTMRHVSRTHRVALDGFL